MLFRRRKPSAPVTVRLHDDQPKILELRAQLAFCDDETKKAKAEAAEAQHARDELWESHLKVVAEASGLRDDLGEANGELRESEMVLRALRAQRDELNEIVRKLTAHAANLYPRRSARSTTRGTCDLAAATVLAAWADGTGAL
jgi:uncharacterized coiled-coil DUF342 family protein